MRFRVSNFTSFNEVQEFSMIAGKPRLKMSHLFQKNGISALRFAAVYGANAAGKSNLVKAVKYAQNLILNGFRENHGNTYCRMKEENKDAVSTFEFDIKKENHFYSYGFSAILSRSRIVEEWLFEVPVKDTAEPKLIYSREYGIDDSQRYRDNFSGIEESDRVILTAYAEGTATNDKKSFLSIFDSQKKGLCTKYPSLTALFEVHEWFAETLCVVTPHTDSIFDLISGNHRHTLSLQNFSLEDLTKYLQVLGLGINKVRVSEMTGDEQKLLTRMPELKQVIAQIPVNTEKKKYQQRLETLQTDIQPPKSDNTHFFQYQNGLIN